MIKITTYEKNLMEDIINFRKKVYLLGGRDPNDAQHWSYDDYDKNAIHILAYDAENNIIGAVRLLDGLIEWTLEKHFQYAYNPYTSFEFGRLGVLRPFYEKRRVLFTLMEAACLYSIEKKRTHFYGFVIDEFQQSLKKQRVPFVALSPPLYPYHHKTHLIRFDVEVILAMAKKTKNDMIQIR